MQIQIFKELRMKEVRLVRRLLQYNSSVGSCVTWTKVLAVNVERSGRVKIHFGDRTVAKNCFCHLLVPSYE